MKDLFRWLVWLFIIVLAYAAVIALGLFLDRLPAIALGHMLKG